MPIHALLWDLGGVLVRTADPAPRDALAARLGRTRQELNDLVFGLTDGRNALQLGEVSEADYHAGLAASLGLPVEDIPAMLAEFYAGDVVDYALVAELRRLKGGYRLVLVSNHLPTLRREMQGWGIDHAFHHLVISAEVGLMKPDPAIFEMALEKAGCLAEEAVFVDDYEPHVAAARALGLHAIRFQDSAQALADLRALLEEKNM
ncbi:MAG: HAD family phosphatase [Chloroflexi bacterium]|nr:HAD family phosphatase [Chloroflexota bacterium]